MQGLLCKLPIFHLKKFVILLSVVSLNLTAIISTKAGDLYEAWQNNIGGQTLWIN